MSMSGYNSNELQRLLKKLRDFAGSSDEEALVELDEFIYLIQSKAKAQGPAIADPDDDYDSPIATVRSSVSEFREACTLYNKSPDQLSDHLLKDIEHAKELLPSMSAEDQARLLELEQSVIIMIQNENVKFIERTVRFLKTAVPSTEFNALNSLERLKEVINLANKKNVRDAVSPVDITSIREKYATYRLKKKQVAYQIAVKQGKESKALGIKVDFEETLKADWLTAFGSAISQDTLEKYLDELH